MRTKLRFFWLQMISQNKEVVRRLGVCALNKCTDQHQQAPIQPIDINEPFTPWAMDYIGPFPETARALRY